MDRALWQRHLEQTERDVVMGERHIARQKEIIAELRRDGHDTGSASNLLTLLETTQALHVEHRDRLRKDLADAAPSGR